MTKPTLTQVDNTTKWGLFRQDATTFDDTTILQGNWYATEVDANKALDKLNNELPITLKCTVMTKEVYVDIADRKKTHQYVAMS